MASACVSSYYVLGETAEDGIRGFTAHARFWLISGTQIGKLPFRIKLREKRWLVCFALPARGWLKSPLYLPQ